jgi:hypothetical protein
VASQKSPLYGISTGSEEINAFIMRVEKWFPAAIFFTAHLVALLIATAAKNEI